ncbi:hypothetical protein CPB83DRAFT_895905 [Crepidotus variabilis]|uniref:Uncharacterized protein n=1 Tax=Crepidotus variabilis TaxID=179855 RepID=A0A9P6ECT7_9AGAR|nr:hypothetical protein CPB83DRAFT_895905 [Crepidotus variabilis]
MNPTSAFNFRPQTCNTEAANVCADNLSPSAAAVFAMDTSQLPLWGGFVFREAGPPSLTPLVLSSMFIHKLPQELFDHIIDDIELDYANSEYDSQFKVKRDEALRLCGSISRMFRPRARTLLFSDITLHIFPDYPPPSTKCSQALRSLLDETPHLAKCVQKLTLELATLPGVEYDVITFSDEDLPLIFDMLVNLWSLNLSSENKNCHWGRFEPILRAAFFKLQRSNLIKVLRISGHDLHIPLDILVHWSSLKQLLIDQHAMCAMVDELVPWEILWQAVPQLESLSIFVAGINAMFTILLSFMGTYYWQLLKNLKYLSVEFTDPQEFSLIECLILRMTKQLEKVTFVDLFSMTPTDMMFFYSPRDSLGYLNLSTIFIQEHNFSPEDTPMSIADSIANFASYCPNLEVLRLEPLSWYFSDTNEDLHEGWELNNCDSSIWALLDGVLTTLKNFKTLRVGVEFVYTEEEWDQRVNQHLIDELHSRQRPSVLFPQLWKSLKQNGENGNIRTGVWFKGQHLSEAPKDLVFASSG